MTSSSVIKLNHIHKTYAKNGASVHALRGLDLVIEAGEFTAIMGRSGSGKSTLLHILGLLDAEYEGSYWFDGDLISDRSADSLARRRNRDIGFVFQSFHLLPQLSILENAALPALYAGDRSVEACQAAAREHLEEMGLGDRLDHKPMELSNGQRQRAAIARALGNAPRIILADEPTGALDSTTAQEILDVLLALHRKGTTIILVTHDLEVTEVAQRTVHIRDGQTHDGVV
jgi:putative ABC transport system ATP-binding protein